MLAKRGWLLLLVVIAAVVSYFYGLGLAPLLGPDEPRYAQVAREMFERADWVTPTLGGHTWFEKPALLYWLQMISYSAWGVSEFAARLPSACCGLITILAVAWLARRVEFGAARQLEWLAFASTATLASSIGLIAFSRGASFDIVLTVSVTLALCCFLAADLEAQPRRRRWLLAGFYAGVGLALMAKGLIGAIIPTGTVGLYLLLQQRWPGAKNLGLWWGPLVTTAVAALWYGPVIARHGWPFIDEFFVQHHFARYTSNKYHHPQPFYFYFWVAPLLTIPWTPFLVDALRNIVRWNRRAPDPAARWRVFAFAWMVVPIGFFSLSGSKLPGYVLPALPAMCLLIGDRLAAYLRGEKRGARSLQIVGVLLIVVGLGGSLYAAHAGFISVVCAALIAAPPVAAGALALLRRHNELPSVAAVAAAVLLTVMIAITCAAAQVSARESVRELLQAALRRGDGSTPLVHLHTIERGTEFYASRRLLYDQQGEPLRLEGVGEVLDLARRRDVEGDALLVLVPLQYLPQLTENPALRIEVIGDNGTLAVVAVGTVLSAED